MKRTLLFIFALCASIGLSAQMVSITMNVDMNQHTVSPDGVSLAGGSGFGLPGDNPMTDPKKILLGSLVQIQLTLMIVSYQQLQEML